MERKTGLFTWYANLILVFIVFFAVIKCKEINDQSKNKTDEEKRVQAEYFYQHGNYKEAIVVYRNISKNNPKDNHIYYRISLCYYLLRDINLSEKYIDLSLYYERTGMNLKHKIEILFLRGDLNGVKKHLEELENYDMFKRHISGFKKKISNFEVEISNFERLSAERKKEKIGFMNELMPYSSRFTFLELKILFKNKDWTSFLRKFKVASENFPSDSRICIFKGDYQFQMGNAELSSQTYKKCLQTDPENVKCKRKHRLSYSIKREMDEYKKYSEAGKHDLAIERLNRVVKFASDGHVAESFISKIHLEMCKTHFAIGQFEKSLEMCEKALESDSSNQTIERLIVDILFKLEIYDRATKLLEKLLSKNNNDEELRKKYQEAYKLSQKKIDHYKVLNVSKTASNAEIKKAYYKLAKTKHPDKIRGNDQVKKQAENEYRVITNAYETLIDPQKRAAYDNGDENENYYNNFGAGKTHFNNFKFSQTGFDNEFFSNFDNFFEGNHEETRGSSRRFVFTF